MSFSDGMPQLILVPVVFCNIAGCEVSGMLHHVSLYVSVILFTRSRFVWNIIALPNHIFQVDSHSGFFLADVNITPMEGA